MPSIHSESVRVTPARVIAQWLAFVIALMALSQAIHAADVWMWVDSNGITNYTQQKPRGIDAIRIAASDIGRTDVERATTPTKREPTEPDLTADQQRTLEQLKTEQKANEVEVAAQRRKGCEQAKARLTTLLQNSRVRVKEEDGTERALGEDERQRKISEAQEHIARNCTGVS